MTLGITPVKSSMVASWSEGRLNSQSPVSLQEKQGAKKDESVFLLKVWALIFTNSALNVGGINRGAILTVAGG